MLLVAYKNIFTLFYIHKISMFVPKTTDHDLLLRSNKVALDSGYLNAGQASKQRSISYFDDKICFSTLSEHVSYCIDNIYHVYLYLSANLSLRSIRLSSDSVSSCTSSNSLSANVLPTRFIVCTFVSMVTAVIFFTSAFIIDTLHINKNTTGKLRLPQG
jgi:hypothetical protein